jgi:ATP-dependent Lon protease
MKQSPEITVKMSEDVLRKLIYVSEAEVRTLNNQILLMSRNTVAYFERAKGRIPQSELAKIDLTPYVQKTEE